MKRPGKEDLMSLKKGRINHKKGGMDRRRRKLFLQMILRILKNDWESENWPVGPRKKKKMKEVHP